MKIRIQVLTDDDKQTRRMFEVTGLSEFTAEAGYERLYNMII